MRFRCAVFLLLAGCNALAVHPSEPIYCDAGGEYCAGTDAGPGAPCAINGVLGHITFDDDGSFYCQED